MCRRFVQRFGTGDLVIQPQVGCVTPGDVAAFCAGGGGAVLETGLLDAGARLTWVHRRLRRGSARKAQHYLLRQCHRRTHVLWLCSSALNLLFINQTTSWLCPPSLPLSLLPLLLPSPPSEARRSQC